MAHGLECEQAETREPPSQNTLIAHGVPRVTDTQRVEDGSRIVQEMTQRLPKPPADLSAENLQQYLMTLQDTVREDSIGLGPQQKGQMLLGKLVESYHCQIFHFLDVLLQNINTSSGLFTVMTWVQKSYLSLEMFGQLHLQGFDVTKNLDLLLLTEWLTKAKSKLLENVKKDFRASVEKIQEIDRTHLDHNKEEDCIRFYVDIIQFTNKVLKSAEVSSTLAAEVQQICFQELLSFLQRYFDEQTEALKKKTKMDEIEMVYFLKTLNTCTKIKQYVETNLTKTNDATRLLLSNIIEVLENMEAFSLTCVKKITTKTAESVLKPYFTGKNCQFMHLIHKVKTCFSNKPWCQDVMEKVLAEVYKIITHTYLKQLVKVRPNKLTKSWNQNVSQTLTDDAKLLHNTISAMVSRVRYWNQTLMDAADLLECDSLVAVQLKAAFMQEQCLILREDPDLQVALLRWKGLSRLEIRQVLEAIPEWHTSTSAFWSCFLPLCIRPTDK